MSSTMLILIAGCTVFAVTTLAALWTGYLLTQHRWVTDNVDLTDSDDAIRPLFSAVYPEQLPDHPARTRQLARHNLALQPDRV